MPGTKNLTISSTDLPTYCEYSGSTSDQKDIGIIEFDMVLDSIIKNRDFEELEKLFISVQYDMRKEILIRIHSIYDEKLIYYIISSFIESDQNSRDMNSHNDLIISEDLINEVLQNIILDKIEFYPAGGLMVHIRIIKYLIFTLDFIKEEQKEYISLAYIKPLFEKVIRASQQQLILEERFSKKVQQESVLQQYLSEQRQERFVMELREWVGFASLQGLAIKDECEIARELSEEKNAFGVEIVCSHIATLGICSICEMFEIMNKSLPDELLSSLLFQKLNLGRIYEILGYLLDGGKYNVFCFALQEIMKYKIDNMSKLEDVFLKLIGIFENNIEIYRKIMEMFKKIELDWCPAESCSRVIDLTLRGLIKEYCSYENPRREIREKINVISNFCTDEGINTAVHLVEANCRKVAILRIIISACRRRNEILQYNGCIYRSNQWQKFAKNAQLVIERIIDYECRLENKGEKFSDSMNAVKLLFEAIGANTDITKLTLQKIICKLVLEGKEVVLDILIKKINELTDENGESKFDHDILIAIESSIYSALLDDSKEKDYFGIYRLIIKGFTPRLQIDLKYHKDKLARIIKLVQDSKRGPQVILSDCSVKLLCLERLKKTYEDLRKNHKKFQEIMNLCNDFIDACGKENYEKARDIMNTFFKIECRIERGHYPMLRKSVSEGSRMMMLPRLNDERCAAVKTQSPGRPKTV